MTVAEINALLYLPGHPANGLERALRIPALSAGWRTSLQALLDRERKRGGATGNPGLGPLMGPPPAWQGFRPLRVSQKLRESSNVTSLILKYADGEPLTPALAGQFVVLRLGPRPVRAYPPTQLLTVGRAERGSLSHQCQAGAARRRRGLHRYAGSGGRCSRDQRSARQLYVAAGRWSCRPCQRRHRRHAGAGDVARIGHQATVGDRFGGFTVRDSSEHPFAAEVRELLKTLPGSRSHSCYSAPKPADRPNVDFDEAGRVGVPMFEEMGVPADADFIISAVRRIYERSRRRSCRLGGRP